MDEADRVKMDVEAARLRAFNGRVIMLTCQCGHDLETDYPADIAKSWPCNRCGAVNWKLRGSSTMAKDPTAPDELKKRSKKATKEEEE